MPNPGDQHQHISNPFQNIQPQQGFGDMNQQNLQQQPAQRLSEYTAQEIATLQSRLEKQLGPEYLSARSGPSGQKVHYIAAEKVITLANEVFGFNGWSSSIQNIQVDFVDEHPQTLKISVGLSVIVRVTLRDGTYHEDIGYGHIENCKGKAAAFEKAKKEGTTDALKRALRSFGNVLGNCIYDKKYVERVSKMKAVPVNKRTFAEQGLHRHADYVVKSEDDTTTAVATAVPTAAARLPQAVAASVKTETSVLADTSEFAADMFDDDLLGDFDEADFCVTDEGHPDEFVVRESSVPALPPPQQSVGSRNTSPLRQVVPQQNGNYNNQQRPARPGVPPGAPQTPTPMNARPIGNGSGNGFGQRPYQPGANHQQTNGPQQQGQRPQGFGSNGSNHNGSSNNNNNNSNNNSNNNNNNNNNSNNNNNNNNNNVKPTPLSTVNSSGGNGNNGAAGGAGEVEPTPWLSARAVAKVGGGDPLPAVVPKIQGEHLFDPKAESPSIRKTPGFDHNSSKPIPRLNRPSGSIALPPSANAASNVASASTSSPAAASNMPSGAPAIGGMTTRSGVHHPGMEPIRRIGAPPSTASPLANRNQFRPPPMKRGPPTDSTTGASRPPLADVPSNVPVNGGTIVAAGSAGAASVDAKRQKLA
ncbi:DNA repair and recombination protein RAD52 [Sporothrix schenckii 1099-18]|uniref:RAD52 homolog n=1 Tax=Sporothrix schenckii 1099-18 TaxID=1397361 RepID=A0A0F2M668_SPOSC|nr:DNA repair and recombination protein RAD52 [Sporothrix schenckii 1099-18]KJR84584.1 DNA repair and recombination protein RAD52 [Sporothrix schenckii 1099-18]